MSSWGEPPDAAHPPYAAPQQPPSPAPHPTYAASAMYAQVPRYVPQPVDARPRIRVSTFVWFTVVLVAVIVLIWLSGPVSPLRPGVDAPGIYADTSGEYAVKTENLGNATGTDVEDAVDRISGGISALVVDDTCGEVAVACVFRDSSTIFVTPRFARMSEEEILRDQGMSWDHIIQHEFMHVLQGKLGSEHAESARLRAMFSELPVGAEYYGDDVDWPVELEADCMAEARYPDFRHAYVGRCSEEQLDFARATLRAALGEGSG